MSDQEKVEGKQNIVPNDDDEKKIPTQDQQQDIASDDDSSATDDDGVIVDEAVKPESFLWEIPNFVELQKKCMEEKNQRYHSPTFEIGSAKWRMLLFPNGNSGQPDKGTDHLSFYLECADHDDPELPKGWKRKCKFWLTVVNQLDHDKNVRQEEFPTFHANLVDWGFPRLIALDELTDPEKGFLKDGSIKLEAELIVKRIWVDKISYGFNSRAETGFVGLRNQGATCYLNSLMQGLYHIGAFRRSVHMIPTHKDNVKKSVPLALQRLFYRLSTSKDACTTKELTRSFGWSSYDSFKQHDVQELNRVLMDNLETKMKGTVAEGSIERLFRGQLENYIQCVNVDYASTRSEHFYDLSLVVKGCTDIYESFEKYVEEELMDGENQYRAEGHGLQDAKRGVRFKTLPPVLNIQLKRWEMDYVRFQPYKVNDLYRFDPILDLSKYMDRTVTKESGVYHLHAVLVHSGSTGGGHYYAFVRPTTDPSWYKFNDSCVSAATEAQAINDNWGGVEERHWRKYGKVWSYNHQRTANAYMLIYVRETEAYQFMNDTADDVVQEHLKKADDNHLYAKYKICSERDLLEHDQHKFDLVDREKVKDIRLKKDSTINDFKAEAEKMFGIPKERQRYWVFNTRDNKTFRPDRTLSIEDQNEKMCWLSVYNTTGRLLFVQEAREDELVDTADGKQPAHVKVITDNHIDPAVQLFFKYYDPVAQTVQYVGSHMFTRENNTDDLEPVVRTLIEKYNNLVSSESTPNSSTDAASNGDDSTTTDPAPADVKPDSDDEKKDVPSLKEISVSADDPIDLFEEIVPVRVDPVEKSVPLGDGAELRSGDIIVFMKHLSDDEAAQVRFPTPKEWYTYIKNRRIVRFRPLADGTNDANEFTLDLRQRMSNEKACAALAKHLKCDADKIRFTGHDLHSGGPRYLPYDSDDSLADMLNYFHRPTDLLFYEVLPVPLAQLERMKKIKIAFQDRSCTQHTASLLVDEDATISDLYNVMLEQTDFGETVLSKPELTYGTKKFRFCEQFNSRIFRTYSNDERVDMLSSHTVFIIEEYSPEELEADHDKGDRLVRFCHYEINQYNSATPFGKPFTMYVYHDDTLAAIKKRIQERLNPDPEDFKTWKFTATSYSMVKDTFTDDDCVPSQLQEFDEYTHFGLQHVDNTPKSKANARSTYSSRYGGGGGGIKIHN
eukprot:CAMPEP_0201551132 /NCGR_PEP_ID=MMETSP0173_2-20130828/7361_1 /ASSEMBLY_ACC=CAM_ASM_000268 /TAXON_ID=218659 /ORGANISM="Vexillifera sp., Strain DIVA3 564/2" /LENGTH=1177 /DNA_ID=CAMNT_0047961315 /DNA_START=842 /DNA_END=4378 /DNA_ORIENTATION=-